QMSSAGKHTNVIDPSCPDDPTVSTMTERCRFEPGRLGCGRCSAIRFDEVIDDGARGPLRPRGKVVGRRQVIGKTAAPGCDPPARQRSSLRLEQCEELRMPLGVLNGGRRSEHQDVFEAGREANNPVLYLRTQAMEFVDHEDI